MEEQLKARRAHYFVDNELQGTLLRRVIFYWLIALAIMSTACFATKALWGAPPNVELFQETAKLLVPAFVISLLPLPLILRDLIRATHRFAGPMLRVRRGLSDLARDGKSPPIVPRDGDAWPDCIANFNELASRVSEAHGVQS